MTHPFPYQLTDRLYVLGHNLFTTYLVKGDTCALLDLGASATAPLIVEQLAQLGVTPDQVEHLVVQHAHWDHVGALPYLRNAFPQAKVLGSQKAADVLAKAKIVTQFRQNDELWCTRLRENGTFSRLPAFLPYETLTVDRVVADGETLSLGGVPARFLATPGHSPCSLTVHFPTERTALVSDAIGFYLPDCDGILPMFFQSVPATLASLDAVEQLDIDRLGYGHALHLLVEGKENLARAYKRLREETTGLVERLKQLAAGGAPEDQLLAQLHAVCYRDFLAELYQPEYLAGVAPFLLKAALAA